MRSTDLLVGSEAPLFTDPVAEFPRGYNFCLAVNELKGLQLLPSG